MWKSPGERHWENDSMILVGFPRLNLDLRAALLVGGWATPLKHDGVRQWWWHSQDMEKKVMFQTTNQYDIIPYYTIVPFYWHITYITTSYNHLANTISSLTSQERSPDSPFLTARPCCLPLLSALAEAQEIVKIFRTSLKMASKATRHFEKPFCRTGELF